MITSSGSPCGSEAGPWPGSGRNHRLSSSGSRCSDSEASHLVEMLRFLVVRMSRPSKAVAAVSASKCVVPTRFGHPRVSSGRTTCPDASMSSSTLDELFTTRRDTPAGAAAPAWVQRPCWWSWCRAYGRSDAVPAIDEGYHMEHLTGRRSRRRVRRTTGAAFALLLIAGRTSIPSSALSRRSCNPSAASSRSVRSSSTPIGPIR